MQFKRPRTKCELCPLKDHKHVYSELVADGSKPKIAILGEAPGREEDRDGKPFTGPSGKLVNWALHECSIARNNVYVANSICCMPTGQAMDTLEASEALSYCRAGLYDELVAQYDRGLRVLIALGQIAMKQLGLEGKVGTYRGSLMSVVLPGDRKLTVIPTYHPSMVLRMNWKRSNGGTAKGAVEWLADWQKAARIAGEGGAETKQLRELFELNPTVEQIEEFCNLAVCENKLVAVDIETSGLGFDACKIVVVGLAIDSEHAMCVPFLKECATPCFTNGSWERVKNALKRLFSTCKQVYQNSFFDVPRLRAFGFPIPYKLISHDTMILHHCLAAELPHDLGYIVSVYGRTPYWKDDFKNRTGTIYEMDQIEMRRYNLRDCVVLHQILATMLRDLKELDLEDIYYKEALPLIEPVMEMTQYGVGIDLGRVKRYKVDLEKRVEQGTVELYQLGNLPPEFNVASTSHMRWFLYGEPITAFAKIDERDAKARERGVVGDSKLIEVRDKLAKIELAIAVAERDHKSTVALEKRLIAARAALDKRLLPKAQTQIDRDIEALRVVRDTVKPLYQLASWRPLTTDSGLLATDKEGLLSFKIALTNRRLEALSFKLKDGTEEVAAIDKLLAFIDLLGKVSLYRKLISTYTNFQPWADGRIHPYWKMHGTASGRLAATQPNLQNMPAVREDADDVRNAIRGFFVARSGWKMISADYVNLEAQLLAYSTLEPELVDVFTHGLNLHDVNTRALFGVTPDSPGWKSCRKAAKIDFFANKCYGGSDYAIYQKIILEVPELRMTYAEYAAANAKWFASHPAYSAWAARVRNEVRQRRQARTPFGRVRFFLDNDRDIEKEALNHMIQSSGASLVNRAMVRIERKLRAKGMKTRFVMQVHDELIIEAPDDEVESAKKILVDEMSRPFEFLGFTRSIPVEAAVGSDLAHL
jgi:uracil-DNA glycosylase family 4